MLAIGGAAGAASFTHVHNVAAAHGQPGWLAWADAVVLELMSIASGLELRRRKRAHTSTVFPATVLDCAVTLSLAAQVVEAEPSPIGWIAAAVPALGFLVMVKVALGYASTAPGTDRATAVPSTVHPVSPSITSASPGGGPEAGIRSGARAVDPAVPTRTVHQTDGGRRPDGPDPHQSGRPGRRRRPPRRSPSPNNPAGINELLPAARRVHERLTAHGQPLTRAALAAALRAAGHTVSNTRASELLKILKAEQAAAGAPGSHHQAAASLAADTEPATRPGPATATPVAPPTPHSPTPESGTPTP
ncbi:DUF2637 domain-containing protein [Micromonospora sp. NPDC023814]|uniref:DUF2637 domain-containing protein n=1 Tax=Micromonospora sp. NPDC023814 TaxID=3154596 RepID=UPI0033F6B505